MSAHAQKPDTTQRARTQRTDTTQRADTLLAPDTIPVRAPVRLCAGGDVTLGTNLDTTWAKLAARRLRAEYGLSPEPDSLLAPLRPLLADADVVLLNVEGAIGVGRAPQKCSRGSKNCYAFRQPVATAAALRRLVDSAVVVGNVANNHARDAGEQGLAASMTHLRRAGVFVTGADTLATPVVTRAGDTLAFLGFHTSADAPDARDLAAVRRHVARAAEQYSTVVVTMHLGAEGPNAQRTLPATEMFLGTIDRGNPVAFADAAFESGATVVIGHGPHVLRAAEWRGDRLVLYSLGNLLTYGPFRLVEPLNRGAIVCVTIDSARHVGGAELRSTVQLGPGVLLVDSTARAAALIDSLSALDFPESGARIAPDGRFLRDSGHVSGASRALRSIGAPATTRGHRGITAMRRSGGDRRLKSRAELRSREEEGVPIRDASGCIIATLCHFDVRPRLIPPNEISALELVKPVIGDWLQTGSHRA